MKDKNNLIEWLLIGIIILIFSWLIVQDCTAQTITKIYAKNGLSGQRIRIDGSTPHNKDTADIFFPGGAFTLQNWGVDNKLSVMSVKKGHVSFKAGYPVSFPSLSAANKGIDYCVLAVLWVKAHADEYGIDTNAIYLWGTSAGGFCALGVAYQHKINVAGIVNMWGGILNLSYLGQNNIPVFNTSTEFDPTVPVGCGKAFGVSCCGSQAITDELLARGVKTDWLVFPGQKHGLSSDVDLLKIFNEAELFFK